MAKISGKNGAANAGSRCINVPNMITIIPISSSLYSSSITPHSVQRWHTQSSPILNELCFRSVCDCCRTLASSSSSASESSRLGSVGAHAPANCVRLSGMDCESTAKGPIFRRRCRCVRYDSSLPMIFVLSCFVSCPRWCGMPVMCWSSDWCWFGGDSRATCLMSRRGDVVRLSRVLPRLWSKVKGRHV